MEDGLIAQQKDERRKNNGDKTGVPKIGGADFFILFDTGPILIWADRIR